MESMESLDPSLESSSTLNQDGQWRKELQASLKADKTVDVFGSADPYSLEIVPEEEDSEDRTDQSDDEDASEESDEDKEKEEVPDKEDRNSEVLQTGTKRKITRPSRKSKKVKKAGHERRNIRKILDEGQLDPQTLEAQMEERERLRRLELQKSLQKAQVNSMSSEDFSKVLKAMEEKMPTEGPHFVDATRKDNTNRSVVVISDDEDVDNNTESLDKLEDRDIIALLSSSEDSYESDAGDESDEYMDAHMNDDLNVKTPGNQVLINVSHPADEPDIFVAPQIARSLKPHQIGGIRFLYDNLIESIKRANSSGGTGFGCILAHSMGLGKTVQTIAFIDVFLRYTSAKKVLCVVPINTIINWINEFNMWVPASPEKAPTEAETPTLESSSSNPDSSEIVLPLFPGMEAPSETADKEQPINDIMYRKYEIYALTDAQKTTVARGKIIGMWHQKGGVLLMGYEMFRMLSLYQPSMCNSLAMSKNKKKKQKEKKPVMIDVDEEEKEMHLILGMQRAICKPGPDLVVCDEGHRIKNYQSNLSQALHKIKTRRRLVLTGYPLQNNLIEYWCMVDFVRPNYLGSRGEFSNMFERPIMNGQCLDSTPADKKLMRYRAHVLNSLLKGFVQRRDHGVLRKVLSSKEEYVIMTRLSDAQEKLYQKFISLCTEVYRDSLNPIKLFTICSKIWNHPDILYTCMLEETGQSPEVLLDTDDDISNLASPATKKKGSSDHSSGPGLSNDSETRALLNSVKHWATEVYSSMNYVSGVLENSGKMTIMMEIVHESLAQGDKLLLFSQSLLTLDLIEKFLHQQAVPCYDSLRGLALGSDRCWTKNKDYYRIDGRTASSDREKLIRSFNDPANEAKLFLLSTRAGCLGINLTGANRVIVFDVSWNPCHDAQAVCRVYRYGQSKKCHIYRLVASNTMEQRIYYRQVSKQGISDRVVDELNPGENFTKDEMHNLIATFWEPEPAADFTDDIRTFEDPVMMKLLSNSAKWVTKSPFQHESLLEDQARNRLSRSEKKMARLAYEKEKQGTTRFSIYNDSYSRPRPDQRPIVVVPPFIQTQPQAQTPQVLTSQLANFSRSQLAVVSSYLRQLCSLNRPIYQAGMTFNQSMYDGGLGSNFFTRHPLNPGVTLPAPYGFNENPMSTVTSSSSFNGDLVFPHEQSSGTSTLSRDPDSGNKYPPYRSHSTMNQFPTSQTGNTDSPNTTRDPLMCNTDLLTGIQSSLTDVANTLLNYKGPSLDNTLSRAASSCRVAKEDEVVVIDVDD